MDSKQQQQQSCPSPATANPPFSSSLFKDISNFKTPKHTKPLNPKSHTPHSQFFTSASKNTPLPQPQSSSSYSFPKTPHFQAKTSTTRSKVARRLKAFELEQSKSARKAQINKEKSLKSLARSLTVWLNFLFQNPSSCGVDLSKFTGEDDGLRKSHGLSSSGKRDSWPADEVGVDTLWRGPKRQKDSSWTGSGVVEMISFKNLTFSALESSLKEVCSFDDLKERMRVYLSLGSCKEIFDIMSQVTKNIDEGRLKMKKHCPIVTDVGMKEKAMRILMCYNPIWLQIGLYIIFGGDSLLPNEGGNFEQETTFLKMIIEKQFFSHAGLAKAYAYNKLVEGLYRPGYFDKVGNVILKRFLLLVLILDRIKFQSCLPLKYGIDGRDGGSPLLFNVKSNFNSSRQMINDFLSSDVMYGEGNILAHLVILGYKVSYHQSPLTEYDFRVTNLFEDLRDGIRLCRAIQLLQHDCSILMKMVVPSDTRKKNLVNNNVFLQYLKQSGVPLHDEDGTVILAEDVVNVDKELMVSLLWNMFVHLQLPLLINKALLSEEISKIHGLSMECSNTLTLLDMLLSWIQAICKSYGFLVENFASLVDGKAMWCLLDYYFRKEHYHFCSLKDPNETKSEASIMSSTEYADAVHNFILSQKLTSLLGNFPEVLQVCDILEHNGACNYRSVVILLVFLSFQLISKRSTDQRNFHRLLGFDCENPERKCPTTKRLFTHFEAVLNQEEMLSSSVKDADSMRNFKAIMAWWQDMARQNSTCIAKQANPLPCFPTGKRSLYIHRENAAVIIQSNLRQSFERRKYLRMLRAISLLQTVIRAWLAVKNKLVILTFSNISVQELFGDRSKNLENFGRHVSFIVERHCFVMLRRAVVIIQHATRVWITRRHRLRKMLAEDMPITDLDVIAVQKCDFEWANRSTCFDSLVEEQALNEMNGLQMRAAFRIQVAWKNSVLRKTFLKEEAASIKIQSYFRGWLFRRSFLNQRQTSIKIQSIFRSIRPWRNFELYKLTTNSAILIQSYVRGWIVRREAYRQTFLIIMLQSCCRGWLERSEFLFRMVAILKLQSGFRGWFIRRELLFQIEAVVRIQSAFRGFLMRRELSRRSEAALRIQSAFRGLLIRRKLASQRVAVLRIQSAFRGLVTRRELALQRVAVLRIQSAFRGLLIRRELLLQRKAVRRIQSAFQCSKCWKSYHSYRHAAIEIQRFIRDSITRKRLLGASLLHEAVAMDSISGSLGSEVFLCSITKLQRWWRSVLLFRLETKSAIIIQSHVRVWLARKRCRRQRHRVVVIQSYWKGYLARKDSRQQLHELRLRMQNSAVNADDGMRIINRLIAALNELLSMKSVSGILHTCATLDMATEHSQKCCEKLVAVGAVDTLLKLIRSISRSVPDQQVLKHALSTLRNLARYPHLAEALIYSRASIETLFLEFLRNKDDGYFIACDLLKKICLNQKGREAAANLRGFRKRLQVLVENLTRQAGTERRSTRALASREQTERRLREAVEILRLISNG